MQAPNSEKTLNQKDDQGLFAVFPDQTRVERAKKALLAAGVPNEELFVFRLEPAKRPSHFGGSLSMEIKKGSLLGAAIGAFVGVIAFFIILAVRGLGDHTVLVEQSMDTWPLSLWYFAPIFCAFLGAACGALVGIGTPGRPAERYFHYLEDGGILMSVHVPGKKSTKRLSEILRLTGGFDICKTDYKQTLFLLGAYAKV